MRWEFVGCVVVITEKTSRKNVFFCSGKMGHWEPELKNLTFFTPGFQGQNETKKRTGPP
jgi:hypothetical protein